MLGSRHQQEFPHRMGHRPQWKGTHLCHLVMYSTLNGSTLLLTGMGQCMGMGHCTGMGQCMGMGHCTEIVQEWVNGVIVQEWVNVWEWVIVQEWEWVNVHLMLLWGLTGGRGLKVPQHILHTLPCLPLKHEFNIG